jgi:hypothetical protein
MQKNLRMPPDFYDEFLGGAIPPGTLAAGMEWQLRDTSAAGAPAISYVTATNNLGLGELSFAMSSTSEATVLGIDFGDVRPFYVDRIQRVEFGLRLSQTNNATTRLAFGVGTAFNADPQAQAAHAQFRFTGNNVLRLAARDSASNVEQATTTSVPANQLWQFVIDFAKGKNALDFYAGPYATALQIVSLPTKLSMASSTDALQPFIIMTKASGTQQDAFVLDYCRVELKR